MSGFLLDISGRFASTVFSKRFKIDSFEKDAICGDPDFNVTVIDVDPYTDSSWSGLKLMKWGKLVRKRYEDCLNHIHQNVLEQVHKNKIESWMSPIVDQQKTLTKEYSVLKKLIEMIERAEKNNGTILFFSD